MTQDQIICSYNAVEAVIAHRPNDIIRLHFTPEMAPRFGPICKELAATRRIYRTGTPEELEALCRSSHHGGVVAIAKLPALSAPSANDLADWKKKNSRILAFDRVGNTHNMGAMVRSAAFLGVEYLLVEDSAASGLFTPSATRVAEGGMESVKIRSVPSLEAFLKSISAAVPIIGTDQGGKRTLTDLASDPKTAGHPCLIVMGNEEHGLSPAVRSACRDLIRIPGTRAVESLNVVTAAAICMYELCRPSALPSRTI